MKSNIIAEKLNFKLLTSTEGTDREVLNLYTCDLLSWAMAKATEDSMWFTVMGNVNTVAVACLKDVSCIVLIEGATLDEDAKARAQQNEIAVYQTDLSAVSAILKVNEILNEV
ncbi:MAG: DRTGG domain-containing protein [Clostridia bacterium]